MIWIIGWGHQKEHPMFFVFKTPQEKGIKFSLFFISQMETLPTILSSM
jgi:hypothetical protein